MYAKLLGVLLFACTIIHNESSVVHGNRSSARTTTLPEGYVSFSEDHAAYKIHQISVTWNRARDLCIAEGAQLAIADTVEKIQNIYSTLSKVNDWVSVGIQLSKATNKWVRIDNGLPLTSLPWQKDNPYNTGDCVGISFSGNALVNFLCDWSPNWYVCEIPI